MRNQILQTHTQYQFAIPDPAEEGTNTMLARWSPIDGWTISDLNGPLPLRRFKSSDFRGHIRCYLEEFGKEIPEMRGDFVDRIQLGRAHAWHDIRNRLDVDKVFRTPPPPDVQNGASKPL